MSDKLSGERVKQVMEHIWKFQEFCNSMTRLETDNYEYAYLKAIVLFSPGEYERGVSYHIFLTVVYTLCTMRIFHVRSPRGGQWRTD